MKKDARRGISPVIATVIIVAVAIAIAIAVAGWIMGLWGGFGQTESLKVFPDSYINATNDTLILNVQNVGGSTAQIYKIEVSGEALSDAAANYPIVLDPGVRDKLIILLDTDGNTGNGAEIDASAGVAYT
ncbi:MAG: hypothetical protein F7C81_06600, partial [Desulfurococcales archaeon]|nr:hypothetical protein [Desulfurococcales archaeon]